MTKTFKQGERVKVLVADTMYWPGSINYVRFAPPTYSEPEVYSIFLDNKIGPQNYAGSIYGADKVFSE